MPRDPGGVLFDVCGCTEDFGDEVAQVIGVVSGIRDDMADAIQPLDQTACLRALPGLSRPRRGHGPSPPPLPWRDRNPDRQTERIDGGVDLRPLSAIAMQSLAGQWSGRLSSVRFRQPQARFLRGRIGVRLTDRRVDQDVFEIRVSAQRLEKTLPDARERPPPEP